MKNIISFITLTLCIMVSAVNAQNTTAANTSTSIVLSHNVASVIEDVDTEDVARNMAMSLEEVSPETTPVMSVSLNQGFTKVVAAVIEDVDANDVAARNMAIVFRRSKSRGG